MVDFTIIAGILTQLREWFSVFNGGANRKDDRYTAALKALFSALIETQVYLAHLGRTDTSKKAIRDFEREAKLSQLWTDASVFLRAFDRGLAARCFDKARYWTNPDEWTQVEIEKAGIEIDAVLKDARMLL